MTAAGDPVTVTKPGAARSGQSGTVVETTAQGALVRFEDSEVEAFKFESIAPAAAARDVEPLGLLEEQSSSAKTPISAEETTKTSSERKGFVSTRTTSNAAATAPKRSQMSTAAPFKRGTTVRVTKPQHKRFDEVGTVTSVEPQKIEVQFSDDQVEAIKLASVDVVPTLTSTTVPAKPVQARGIDDVPLPSDLSSSALVGDTVTQPDIVGEELEEGDSVMIGLKGPRFNQTGTVVRISPPHKAKVKFSDGEVVGFEFSSLLPPSAPTTQLPGAGSITSATRELKKGAAVKVISGTNTGAIGKEGKVKRVDPPDGVMVKLKDGTLLGLKRSSVALLPDVVSSPPQAQPAEGTVPTAQSTGTTSPSTTAVDAAMRSLERSISLSDTQSAIRDQLEAAFNKCSKSDSLDSIARSLDALGVDNTALSGGLATLDTDSLLKNVDPESLLRSLDIKDLPGVSKNCKTSTSEALSRFIPTQPDPDEKAVKSTAARARSLSLEAGKAEEIAERKVAEATAAEKQASDLEAKAAEEEAAATSAGDTKAADTARAKKKAAATKSQTAKKKREEATKAVDYAAAAKADAKTAEADAASVATAAAAAKEKKDQQAVVKAAASEAGKKVSEAKKELAGAAKEEAALRMTGDTAAIVAAVARKEAAAATIKNAAMLKELAAKTKRDTAKFETELEIAKKQAQERQAASDKLSRSNDDALTSTSSTASALVAHAEMAEEIAERKVAEATAAEKQASDLEAKAAEEEAAATSAGDTKAADTARAKKKAAATKSQTAKKKREEATKAVDYAAAAKADAKTAEADAASVATAAAAAKVTKDQQAVAKATAARKQAVANEAAKLAKDLSAQKNKLAKAVGSGGGDALAQKLQVAESAAVAKLKQAAQAKAEAVEAAKDVVAKGASADKADKDLAAAKRQARETEAKRATAAAKNKRDEAAAADAAARNAEKNAAAAVKEAKELSAELSRQAAEEEAATAAGDTAAAAGASAKKKAAAAKLKTATKAHVEAAKAKVAASATKASAQKASAEAAVALKAKRAQSDAFALNSPVERRGLCICCSYPNNPDVALPGAVSDQRAMEKMLIENGYEVTFISDEDSSSTRKSGEPVIVIDPSHTRSGQRGTVVEAALGEETTVRFADGEVQAIPSKSLALDHSTREGMLSNIKALCEWLDAKPNRQGWISYSGHGAQTADTSGEEADGLDECMIPTDYQEAGLLTDDDLKEICAFRNDSSLMVFMDCCHSGAHTARGCVTLPSAHPASPVTGTILDLPFELQSTAIGPEYEYDDGNGLIFCVSAALDSQEAFETNEGGICTRAFLGAYTPGAKPAEVCLGSPPTTPLCT